MLVSCILVTLGLLLCTNGVYSSSQTFSPTGSYQLFTVPSDVTYLIVELVGGNGGSGTTQSNGRPTTPGATVNTRIPVTPGQLLYVYVGGNGGANGGGGFNGGGAGSGTGYGGGGASDIRVNETYRLAVAAGGGGQGGTAGDTYGGGYGACAQGQQGSPTGNSAPYGGYGGTLTQAGAGGFYSVSFSSGSAGGFGSGGAGAYGTDAGGGGAGYYGGGGGSNTAGGGGSSYSISTHSCYTDFYNTKGPYVTITYPATYTYNYEYSGEPETLSIPDDVSNVLIEAAGAQGGSFGVGKGTGGLGGYVSGNFSVTPSSTLTITVGGTNGYNGGSKIGSSTQCGSEISGGGATTVQLSYPSTTLVKVGGGGSAGYDYNCSTCIIDGGKGGGNLAGQGSADPNMPGSYGGLYGTQAGGGAGGYFNSQYGYGLPGTSGSGGTGAIDTCGGGGGGGYYGGGGGSFTGGGGGSTYISSTNAKNIFRNLAGNNTGDGFVIITYSSIYEPDGSSGGNTLSDGAIAGIVIGSVALLCICVFGGKKAAEVPEIRRALLIEY